MARRSIQLRWHGRCSVCRAEMAVGETARFDDVSRELTCADCVGGVDSETPPARVGPPVNTGPAPVSPRIRTTTDPAQVRALIADARAALSARRQAG